MKPLLTVTPPLKLSAPLNCQPAFPPGGISTPTAVLEKTMATLPLMAPLKPATPDVELLIVNVERLAEELMATGGATVVWLNPFRSNAGPESTPAMKLVGGSALSTPS